MTVRSDICNECPFRREGMQGWLGRNDPESFAAEAVSERSVACHTMVDQTLPRKQWEQAEMSAPRCRGAMTMLRNMCKMPRDKEMAELYRSVPADRERVFSNHREFVEYHENAKVKSWQF